MFVSAVQLKDNDITEVQLMKSKILSSSLHPDHPSVDA